MADFFISYRGSDVTWAKWIAWELKQAGFEVIYQAADFRDGPLLVDQINHALASTHCTIAVISPDYFKSKWCEIEWQTAYTLAVSDPAYRLLLIVIKSSDLPPLLKARTWLELIGLDEATARQKLLRSIQPEAQPPRNKTAVPHQQAGRGSFPAVRGLGKTLPRNRIAARGKNPRPGAHHRA